MTNELSCAIAFAIANGVLLALITMPHIMSMCHESDVGDTVTSIFIAMMSIVILGMGVSIINSALINRISFWYPVELVAACLLIYLIYQYIKEKDTTN